METAIRLSLVSHEVTMPVDLAYKANFYLTCL